MGMASGRLPAGIKAVATGSTTIQQNTDNIIITTNLGYIPDFAYLYAEIEDYNKFLPGSCLDCKAFLTRYKNVPNLSYTTQFNEQSWYKHPTSNNMLSGGGNYGDSDITENQFKFRRANYPFFANDADGNPITYRWIAIKFDDAIGGINNA